MAKKEKQAVWLYPEVKELLTTHMAAANAMSQSDFIEKAIRFYAGYLDCNSENMTEYLGETVSAVIDGIVKGSEQRISRALFKLAVQSAIQSHILAAVTDGGLTLDKIRTGIYVSGDVLAECDDYCTKQDISRSELIEQALKLFLATRAISTKSNVLVPELAECIAQASDEGITKISKGLFRYAVEVEMLIAILVDTFELSKNELKDIRREAVNNVRRTRGKINFDDLITRNFDEGIADDE